MLIYPGDPEFDATLATARPPGWQDYAASTGNGDHVAFVADCQSGLLRPADWDEVQDYSYGGEWEERMINLGWTSEELEQL